MLKTIKRVGDDWDYIHDNYQYARVVFFNEFMGVNSITLKDIEFFPIYNEEVSIDGIKKFYSNCIDEGWSMNMTDFKNNYENLVELVLYDNTLIILKFQKEKYYKLFNIRKGYPNYEQEELFAPYSFKLILEYTTFEGEKKESSIKLIFGTYIEDTLMITRVISSQLTIETEPFTPPDYIIKLLNKNNEKK